MQSWRELGAQVNEGIRTAVGLRKLHPKLPILILSQFIKSVYAQELFAGGESAIGYLLKDRVVSIAALCDAITQIANGGTALDPEVVSP